MRDIWDYNHEDTTTAPSRKVNVILNDKVETPISIDDDTAVDPKEKLTDLTDLCISKALHCFDVLNETSLKLNGFAKMDPPEVKGPAVLDHMRFLFEVLDYSSFIAEEIRKRF